MRELAIRTQNLTKIYKGELGKKGVKGLDQLDCEVEQGEVYAFLGPNGAGKTTTIKLLTRLLYPTRGKMWILGNENVTRHAMDRVGYLPEQPNLYGYLTGVEFLDFIARLFGLNRSERRQKINTLMEKVGLKDRKDLLIRNYSRGMIQRLGLAQALINDPDLLILDEPMASLDPVGRKDFRDLILALKKEGKTVFFSSHILSDAEMIADRVAILKDGKLVTVGKLTELAASQMLTVEITFTLDQNKLEKTGLNREELILQDENVMIRVQEADVETMIHKIGKWGGRIVSIIPQKMSLETYFMDKVRR
jgi:ABC-2 type transport system ATP-binding protein